MITTAKQRIELLLSLAEQQARNGDIHYSHRYVDLSQKIGMRYNLRIPSQYRVRICRKCRSYLLPGRTSRIRLTHGKMTTTCLRCGNLRRLPYRNGLRAGERSEDNDG